MKLLQSAISLPDSSQRGLGGGGGQGPCMQIDPDGRRGQTSSPPQTLWLNLTLRWEGGSLTLAEPP